MLNLYQRYLKLKRTKIIATIGLTSGTEDVLRKMISSGMNIARLNFSHGDHESHLKVIQNIRKVSQELNRYVAIMGDLCGPKIRVGTFPRGEIELKEGSTLTITTEDIEGNDNLIPSQYPQLVKDVSVGQRILLDDGKLEIVITEILSDTEAKCKVVREGILKNKKGMNIPGSPLSVPAVTEKDVRDLKFCLEQDLEYVALSFVRKAQEIIDLKKEISNWTVTNTGINPEDFVQKDICETRVIAKIEKPEALDEIKAILEASDGIMVARGDLGVEMPPEKVPIVQNELIRMAHQHNRPVIVATQMLESMIIESRPTRAEVSDVANAVLSTADAVMLSGETASGKHPVESVKLMDTIAREIESYQWGQGLFGKLQSDVSIYPLLNAMARSCTLLSQDMAIRSVNVLTHRGASARVMSASRPNAPILAYCSNPKIIRQMVLYWGVYPVMAEEVMNFEQFTEVANNKAKDVGIAQPGQFILLVSCPTKGQPGNHSNAIVLHEVQD